MNLIFLIGMPFSGKTYWAKKLSQAYNIPYVDTDVMVEAKFGKKVAMIFEEEGEQTFRTIETEVLHTIISENQSPLFVACGGGTPVFNNNITAMKQAGCVVYLNASILTLTQRLENIEERNGRPLLANVTDIEQELEDLLERRKSIYKQADYSIDVATITLSSFEQIISSCTNRQ